MCVCMSSKLGLFVPGMDKCACVCALNCSSIIISNTNGRVSLNI